MDFIIKKDSTYPDLIMELVEYNKTDGFGAFIEDLQNSNIVFKMTKISDGKIKIPYKKANCVQLERNVEEYGLSYNFDKVDVNEEGIYSGEFLIYFHDDNNSELIVPIREELMIHIVGDSIRV